MIQVSANQPTITSVGPLQINEPIRFEIKNIETEDLLNGLSISLAQVLRLNNQELVNDVKVSSLNEIFNLLRDINEKLNLDRTQNRTEILNNNLVNISNYNVQQLALLLQLLQLTQDISNNVNQSLSLIGTPPNHENKRDLFSYLQYLETKLLDTDHLVEQVCNNIVGESYYKWDRANTYLPTIVFIFLGDEPKYPKKVQIKMRYLKSVHLPDLHDQNWAQIDYLQQEINTSLSNFHYYSGPLRSNYVSAHSSKWKITIYVKSKQDVISIFELISPIIRENFSETNLSFTEGRFTLNSQEPDQDAQNKAVNMKCFKVVLLVKGLDRPIQLFKRRS